MRPIDDAGIQAKPAAWRRWLGIGLRTAHLASVTWLGAALLGAPLATHRGAAAVAASGAALLAIEAFDRRIRLLDLAGLVSLAKLGVVAWMALDPARAAPLFWLVLVVSALSSHAPRRLRHWRPHLGIRPTVADEPRSDRPTSRRPDV